MKTDADGADNPGMHDQFFVYCSDNNQLGTVMDSTDHKNSFTLLRLAFSLIVVFSHSFAIGGFGLDPLMYVTGSQVQSGFLAVLCFFIVSGFLITGSGMRHPLWRFVLNRLARILPGFWTVQLLTALVLAPILILVKHPGVEGYFDAIMLGRFSALSYLWNNALFHVTQYHIADLFQGLPAGPAINGSLWSLGPEVMCYIYLALLALCGGLRVRIVSLLLFSTVYGVHVLAFFDPDSVQSVAHFCDAGGIFLIDNPFFRSLYVGFVAGMLSFQYRHRLRWNSYWFGVALLLMAAACWFRCFDLVWPFALPYVVLFLAHKAPFYNIERLGDFSFGIYIYSFPIQQCLALAGFQRFGLIPFILTSITLAIAAGVMSWRWIEEPVLKWAKSFRINQAQTALPLAQCERVLTS